MIYDWNFGRLAPYASAFAQGTLTTIELSALVIIVGTLLGVLLGLVLRQPQMAPLLYPLTDAARALPPLVVILFMYYALTPQVVGVSVSAYWVYVLAMSLHLATFTGDLVRSGIEAIPRSLVESGRSLGMTEIQAFRHLFVPHLVRALIAPMTALYIGMIKTSSLASVINVSEVVYAAQTVTVQTSRSLEAWCVVGVIYIAIVVPATYALRWLERRSRRDLPSGFIA